MRVGQRADKTQVNRGLVSGIMAPQHSQALTYLSACNENDVMALA